MPDLIDTGNTKLTVTVNEWFQTLPTAELQQMDRRMLIVDLQLLLADELRRNRAEVVAEVVAELRRCADNAGLLDAQRVYDDAAWRAGQHATT